MKPGDPKNNTWCPQPWLGMGVRSVGDLRFCCNANSSEGRGALKNDRGQTLNMSQDTLESGRNSSLLKEIRKKMMNDERHPSCSRCYKEEDSGVESRRLADISYWSDFDFNEARTKTKSDGEIIEEEFPLRYMDLRFGNRCNLKCRMCAPTESDRWYDQHVQVWGDKRYKDGDQKLQLEKNAQGQYALKVDPYNWFEKPHFWQEMEKYLPQLDLIYIVGGEPLLISEHFEFLQKCIDKGYAHKISLEYNTNLTLLTPKILNIWKEFKKILVGVSMDGVGPVNDYIRHPSDWSTIEKNLKMLDQAPGEFDIWWAATIQVYNLLHLPDMMLWSVKQNFKRLNKSNPNKSILTPHLLHGPPFLSIKIFDPVAKKKIREVFNQRKIEGVEEVQSLSHCSEEEKQRYSKRFENVLDSYLNYLDSEDLSHHQRKFWKYTERLDELHKNSFREVCPEAYELLNGPGVKSFSSQNL